MQLQNLHKFVGGLSECGLFSVQSDLVGILHVLEGFRKIQESAGPSHMRQSEKNRNALPECAFDFIHPFCLHVLFLHKWPWICVCVKKKKKPLVFHILCQGRF